MTVITHDELSAVLRGTRLFWDIGAALGASKPVEGGAVLRPFEKIRLVARSKDVAVELFVCCRDGCPIMYTTSRMNPTVVVNA